MILMDTVPAHSSRLLDAFDDQDRIFANAFSILQNAISERVFPAASTAVAHHGKLLALKAFGHFTYSENEFQNRRTAGNASGSGVPSPASSARSGDLEVHATTLFDLASLTKVVPTTPMAMLLYDRGVLELDAPISAMVPEFLTDEGKDPRRRDVTLRMLLAHSSGLPAYEKLFLKAKTRDELLQLAFTTPLTADPGTHAEYSDIGFIILGIALERLANAANNISLDGFCQREIFSPLGMSSTCFNPTTELRSHIPPTQKDETFRHRIIQGEVQDENAFVLGGVAGHAGLFSTVRDLALFAHSMLQFQNRHFEGTGAGATKSREILRSSEMSSSLIFRPETVALFTRRQSSPPGTSRALGWDTPSSPSQSGRYFSPQAFGHLGYTGTSLWIDPARQLSIALLTNRTWPDCSNQAIKQLRPSFHDAVIEALET